jgi:hypothetical protein
LTLKEAEAATGIPSNTIRKWVRKDAIDTYLESDGELAIRMVDLDSVVARAEELGREIHAEDPRSRIPDPSYAEDQRPKIKDQRPAGDEPPADSESGERKADSGSEAVTEIRPPGTMLVPVDAWNKMLNQLGNLHEAGQQLAEARERAAKAETEALFLRERLREMREDTELRYRMTDNRRPTTDDRAGDSGNRIPDTGSSKSDDRAGDSGYRNPDTGSSKLEDQERAVETKQATTTYWRYLTTGWRDRKRKSNS